MRSVCVFCGSSPGLDPDFARVSRELGKTLAARNIQLIYGGSSIGLMRIMADAALEAGGQVTGIMPQRLIDKAVAYDNLHDFHVVQTMAERKLLMADMADAFIALPGGLGTLDEIFEIMSLNQLSYMEKPIGLLNVNGFYDHLNRFLDHATEQQFIRTEHRSSLLVANHPEELLILLENYKPVAVSSKWIDDLKEMTGKSSENR